MIVIIDVKSNRRENKQTSLKTNGGKHIMENLGAAVAIQYVLRSLSKTKRDFLIKNVVI